MDIINNLPVNIFDLGVIGIILTSALFAYARGFVQEILSIVAWIGAIFTTFYGFPYLIPYGREIISIALVADIAVGVLLFVFTLIFLSLITKGLSKKVQKSALNALDRSLGFLFGLARGGLIIIISYIGFDLLIPRETHPALIRSSQSFKLIKPASKELIELIPLIHEEGWSSNPTKSDKRKSTKSVLDIISPSVEGQTMGKKPEGYSSGPRHDMDKLIRSTQN
ncbi:MAG: hypothetical protein CMF69_09665 [Magnetovibrio sp.]|nr:hypothetical protein [Magnetovibrio sp.]|tara:strand:- start:329 stop:1000 length:672 start_codon:yes stop_codon:yes gene_type:complete